MAATAHGEVEASRSILDVAKCGIFVYIYADYFQGQVEESPAPRNTLLGAGDPTTHPCYGVSRGG